MKDFIFAPEILSAVTEEECRVLAELAEDRLVLEVGSFRGRSTIAMASTARLVHSVDWHTGDPHNDRRGDERISENSLSEFIANLGRYGLGNKVFIHVGEGVDMAEILAPGAFQLVFIDAFHAYNAVRADIAHFRPAVRPGGRLVFHDYGVHPRVEPPFGVTQAVNEFVAREGLGIEKIGSLAIVRIR